MTTGERLLADARRTLNPFTDENMRARFMAELLSAAIATANSCLCGTSLEMARAYIAVYDEMRGEVKP